MQLEKGGRADKEYCDIMFKKQIGTVREISRKLMER